jgi:NAD(P)H-nitrite reductase large subunit
VDSFMRTTDPAIYAVGDAAELPGAIGGLWPVAGAHAAAAVSGMLERPEGYMSPRLLVQLKCDGIDLKSFSDSEERPGDETICAGEDAPAWWRLVVRDGDLVSAVFVGPPASGRDLGRVIQAGTNLRTVLGALRQGRIEALAELV